MSIIFVVFACMFAVFAFFSENSKNREIVDNLNRVELYTMAGKGSVSFEYYIGELDGDTIKYSLSSSRDFPYEMLDEIVASSTSHDYSTGSVGNYYYKISMLANRTIITIGDMTNTILRYSDTLIRFLLILLGAFVVVFLLVIVISNNLFQPIQDTLINQKKFLSDASHELKTPIAVISANADVIKNAEESEWINNIKAQTDRMKTLVTDLLTLSALDENNSVKKKVKFNLSDEVVKVTLFFDTLAYEKGKRIITDVSKDVFATGNPDSVRKITEILIDNAIKYATSGTDIIVSLKVVPHKTVLTVYNQGSNVPKSDAKKIFERFYRGEKSRSRELGGSGLGLSIAKSLASVNKWKISARCELNEFMEIKVVM